MGDVKPFWFCRLIVEHSTAAFVIAVFMQTSFVLLTVFLYFVGSNVLPIDFTDVPLVLEYEPSYRRVAAWNLRNTDPNEPMIRNPSFVTVNEIEHQSIYRQQVADVVEMYYETTDGSNILSYKFLKAIHEFERNLMLLPYYDKFCVLDERNKCRPVDSITQFFPHVFNNETSGYHDEIAEDKNISATLADLMKENETVKSLISDYVNIFAVLGDYPRSTSIRSYLLASWATYESKGDDSPCDSKEFGSKVLSESLWNYSEFGLPRTERLAMKFYYYNDFLYYDRLRYQCNKDQLLAIGSFLFICAFFWFQTRSLFIAAFGMYGILTNFCGANLIYRYVFDYQYFGVFNALAVFLILAIGVDELFVFEETWCSSKDHSFPSLAHRLTSCYKKCCLSIFIPTVTTVAALVQNSFCPLLALSSFGLFAVNLVVLNYLSIITYFPCVLIFYHHHVEKPFLKLCESKVVATTSSVSNENTEQMDSIEKTKRKTKLSHRFCSWYFHLIWSKVFQTFVLVVTLLTVAFFVYQSVHIHTDERPPKLFDDKHLLGISLQKRTREFHPTRYFKNVADFVRIYLIWGISDLDRSMCHKTNWTKCRGKLTWDDNFDLNSYTTQKELMEICHRIRNADFETQENLRMKVSDGVVEIDCFVEQMDKYFNEELKTIFLSERKLTGLPATDVKVEALMMHVPQIFNVNELLNNSFFYRYFEIANLYWLNDGYKFIFPLYSYPPPSVLEELKSRHSLNFQIPPPQKLVPPKFTTENYRKYANLLGHSTNSVDLQKTIVGNYSFVYGTRLRYAAIVINTTIPLLNLRYQDGLTFLDKWESYFSRLKNNVSFALRGGVVATPDSNNDLGAGIWHWMKVQEMMVYSAWQGILIGLCLALPILVLFIDDLLLGALATLMIAFVSVCIIGIIPLVNWKLGLLEALNITLVADLAIDHIVHIAEGYKLSTKLNRREKVEDLLHEIGISILSGAITTLGASSFLFASKIVFFMQFGIFIFITVAFSMIFSLATFVVLLALIGPEDDCYSLSALMKKLFKYICRRCYNVVKFIDTKLDDSRRNSNSHDEPILSQSAGETDKDRTPVVAVVGRKNSNLTTLPNIAKNKPTFLVAIKNDELNSVSRSIDDDNLSSGYESGSVKNAMLVSTSDPVVSDFSDAEETANKKLAQQSFRPKFSAILEETKSHTTISLSHGVDGSTATVDDVPTMYQKNSDANKDRESIRLKIRGQMVSKSRSSHTKSYPDETTKNL